MANNPNRSSAQRSYVILRGDTMQGGYINGSAAKSMAVQMDGGTAYEYDRLRQCAMTWELPLVVDSEGEITRDGARAGYGFLPEAGEVGRVADLGVHFASKQTA